MTASSSQYNCRTDWAPYIKSFIINVCLTHLKGAKEASGIFLFHSAKRTKYSPRKSDSFSENHLDDRRAATREKTCYTIPNIYSSSNKTKHLEDCIVICQA